MASNLVGERRHAASLECVKHLGESPWDSAVGGCLSRQFVNDYAGREVEQVEEEGVGVDDLDREWLGAVVGEVGGVEGDGLEQIPNATKRYRVRLGMSVRS